MNFYKRFLGDYARDTAHLSLAEHGAYTLLLDAMYGTGKPLPADMEALCRICRASSAVERKAVKSVAEQFFKVGDDGLRHNARADREIQSHDEQSAINRAIGKLGGRPKKTLSDIESETESVSDKEPNRGAVRNPSHSHSQKRQQQGAFAPPDWVPADPWKSYVAMRRSIKKPMTLRAAELAVEKLLELREEGNDPAAVLEQSVFNSWQGLFPLKNKPSAGGLAL